LGRALDKYGENGVLEGLLTLWCGRNPQPLVLIIDEIDALVGDSLISVLRQLRSGYDKRPAYYPQSVILCGVRDVKDYRIHSSREQSIITGGSAFNVKAESLRLGNFTLPEITALYSQHTGDTGQEFAPGAIDLVWELTSGQPWLVNALAYDVCFREKEGRDRSRAITPEMIMAAKERMILRRETHLDQLADKLEEDRVRRVIAPILSGREITQTLRKDDVDYVVDLGLIRQSRNGEIVLANRIYQEIIPRELSWLIQSGMSIKSAWYIAADGRLNMEALLASFQEFFREHSEHWVERFDYKEAGPQLLMQAFLQRIVNSGGRIEREYGLGRMRTDLLVIWPIRKGSEGAAGEAGRETFMGARTGMNMGVERKAFGEAHGERVKEWWLVTDIAGTQKVVIELKILHKTLEKTLTAGLRQTAEYMDRCGTSDGHLVIFDRTPGKSWEERIFQRRESHGNYEITVWGM